MCNRIYETEYLVVMFANTVTLRLIVVLIVVGRLSLFVIRRPDDDYDDDF